MIKDDQLHRARLDQDRRPRAIVHEGMFVYANPALLLLLGYQSFEELEAVPILDLVVERYTERIRIHFAHVQNEVGEPHRPAKVKVALLTADGEQLMAIMSSHGSTFEGEQTIEFTLLTKQDTTLKSIFLDLPWRFYFSVLFLLALTVLPNALLINLNINNAPKVFLPADAPSVVIDDRLRELFPSDQVVLLLFEGVALYSDGFLQAFDQLAQRIQSNPLIDDVITVTNQDHIGGSAEGFDVAPLIDTAHLDESRPSQRRESAASDRFARRLLVAADGSSLAMVVIPDAVENSMQRLALFDELQEEISNARLQGYLVAMAGQIVTDVAQLRSMLRDNMTFIPATVVIGLVLIWWMFHRWLAVVVSGIVIGVVVSSTVAIYVISSQPFNLISSIIPPLLSALTIAALIHLFNALHYAASRGATGPERVARALNEIRRPALFTALTTAAGLASLGLSPIPPIRVFGLISAAGVVLIYFTVIHLVPILFARYDYASWPNRRGGMRTMDLLVRSLYKLGIRYPLAVTSITLLLLLAATPAIFKVEVETNLQEFFYPGHEVRQQNEYVQSKLVGTTSLDVIFTARDAGGLAVPAVLKRIRAFQRWVEAQPEVDKSVSMADFIEEMNWGFNAEDDRYRVIPDDPRLISQYLLVYDGNDLFDFVDENYRITHVSLSVNVHGANRISQLMERITGYLDEHAMPGVENEIAGIGRLFADQEDLLVKGQVYSLGGALLLISLLMFLQWRSIGGTLLCMVPNLSPILLIFIIMGLFGIWLDMATAMIASVAVGIAVDDTIHVYHGFISRVKRGAGPVLALVRTYRQAGRAVMTTTIILCAQFLVLVASQFVPTVNFGLLTSVGLLAALLFDLLLLPALLILVYNWQHRPLKTRTPLNL